MIGQKSKKNINNEAKLVILAALVATFITYFSPETIIEKAQGSGDSFTLEVSAVIGQRTSDGKFRFLRNASQNEIAQIKFDVKKWMGQGPQTTSQSVLTGVGPGSYSLPVLTSGEREYSIQITSAPNGYEYNASSWYGPVIWGIGKNISPGQVERVELEFIESTVNPCYLTENRPEGRPIKVTFKADVVDGQGNFVRELTQAEKDAFSFDLVLFFPGRNYGGETGQFENSGQIVNGVNKLGSYNLKRPAYSGIYNLPTYRIINIKSPSGLTIRSISAEETNVDESLATSDIHNVYYYFPGYHYANWFVAPFVCSEASPNLKPEFNITFHLTLPGPAENLKIEDKLLYVKGDDSDLSFVKRFIQTYGNPSTGGDLEAGYLEPHSDFRYAHAGQKPFPAALKIAKFNNKPYLFVDAYTQILVFDISNPLDPVLKSSLKTKDLLDLHGVSGRIGNLAGHISLPSASINLSDDVSYALVTFGVYGYGGIALVKIDPNNLELKAEKDLIFGEQNFSTNNLPIYSYKGSGGKNYYLAVMPSNDFFRQQTHQGNKLVLNTNCSFGEGSCDRYGIFTFENGQVNLVKKLSPSRSEDLLSKEKYGGTSNPDYLLKDSWPVKVATLAGKTYLFAQEVKVMSYGNVGSTGKIKIFDISDPNNISEISATINLSGYPSGSFFDREVILDIDESAKRIYTAKGGRESYPGISPQPSSISVYDLSSLPEKISLLKTYDNICSLLGLSESSDVILRLKKYLQIPSSVNILKANCPIYLSPSYSSDRFSASDSKVSVWSLNSLIDIPNSADVEYGYHSGYGFEVLADLKDLNQPKVLGLISSRRIFLRATGGSNLIPSVEKAAVNDSTLFYGGRYLFRALTRVADVWELKNIPASLDIDTRRPETPPSGQPPRLYQSIYDALRYTEELLWKILYLW